MTHFPISGRVTNSHVFEVKKSRRQFLKQSIYTLVLFELGMTSCVASEQNQVSHSKVQEMTSQERIINSPQYQDGEFHNAEKNIYDEGAAWRAAIKELLFGERVDPVPQVPPPIQRLTGKDFCKKDAAALRFVRLGHSTILLQIGGKFWLLDPIFSERASLFQWIGPKRFHPVPIKINDLPPVEGVLISHDHYDHLDHKSILQLKDRVKHFYVPLGVKELLISWNVPKEKIVEFDWWERAHIGNVELISTPAQHFSGRGLFDSAKTLWTSWVIKTNQHAVYFSGDSGYFQGFKGIGEKYGPFDFTFLECGAYNKAWRTMHMFPEDNIKAQRDLKGKVLVPIHNGTFDLAFHPWYEPMEQVMALAEDAQIKYIMPQMGQIVDYKSVPETLKWWKISNSNT